MIVYSIYIVSKSGGLIFNYDYTIPNVQSEHIFHHYPLDSLKLSKENKRIVVSFGQKEKITVGHVLLSANGVQVEGSQMENGEDCLQYVMDPSNYPLTLKFGRPKMTTNEKIFLASMFYPLFAIASQLSPELKSSGIEVLEADTFKLHCFQSLTGVKFIAVAEATCGGSLDGLLRKIYQLYTDYVLKNPFYSLEMPIRCDTFDKHLLALLQQVDKTGLTNIS